MISVHLVQNFDYILMIVVCCHREPPGVESTHAHLDTDVLKNVILELATNVRVRRS